MSSTNPLIATIKNIVLVLSLGAVMSACAQAGKAVSDTRFANAFRAGNALSLKDAKGFEQYFKTYLATTGFTDSERAAFASVLPGLRDWYVQAGSIGLAYTAVQNRGALMLGGKVHTFTYLRDTIRAELNANKSIALHSHHYWARRLFGCKNRLKNASKRLKAAQVSPATATSTTSTTSAANDSTWEMAA